MSQMCSERGWQNVVYYGGMSHDLRARTIREFRASKETKIMIANLKCGGTGLNLTACSRKSLCPLQPLNPMYANVPNRGHNPRFILE